MTEPLYVASGFGIGLLIGMTGVGGGSLMTPLLILFFGVHPATAVGTDLLFATATKTAGTVVHGTARTIDWAVVIMLAVGSVPATVTTLVALSQFDRESASAQHTIALMLGAVLVITAAFLIAGRSIREHFGDRLHGLDPRRVALFTIILGLVVGFLVTITSVGAGAIGVTVLLLQHPKMPAARVVGTDIAHAVPLTLLAGVGHWYLGSVNWSLLSILLIGSLPGVLTGTYLATRLPDTVVRFALASVLVITVREIARLICSADVVAPARLFTWRQLGRKAA